MTRINRLWQGQRGLLHLLVKREEFIVRFTINRTRKMHVKKLLKLKS